MTDQAFETRLERVLRGYAQTAVRPIDAVALAEDAIAGAVRPARIGGLGWRPASWPAIRVVLVAALLLVVAIATVWLLGAGTSRRPSLVDVDPSPTTGDVTSGPLPVALAGPWIADRPASLSFSGASGAPRMSLFVDGNGATVFVTLADDARELLTATSAMAGTDLVRFSARAATMPVDADGGTLRGCASGESGTYRISRSNDGLRLTLDLIDDPCPSRALVYARTWTRSLGLPNSGGLGVVDAFDPLFTVELPPGGYTTDRMADHLTIVQVVPEFQFLAWKDPQGWNDPCDLAKGRYPIEPGADAFVAYFRQLEGFTVDSTSELEVDGHRAVRLRLHANPDVACPQPWMYQSKAETGTRTWFLRPGDTDSYILVELADDITLMFEVLPAPSALEDQVIGSIRFLDQLPEAP